MVVPFEEYDFENDAKYTAYLKNVELTGAPQDQEALLKRLQAKWYKANVVRCTLCFMLSQASCCCVAMLKDRRRCDCASSTSPG
jgi:hypothetical protein